MTLGQNGTQSPVCRGRVQCITHPTTPWDPLYSTPLEGPFSDHTFYLFLYQRTHYFILSSLQHLYSHFILVPVSSHGPEQAPPVMMGRGAPRRRHLLCCWRPNCSLWKCLTLYFVYFGCKFFFFSFFLSFFFFHCWHSVDSKRLISLYGETYFFIVHLTINTFNLESWITYCILVTMAVACLKAQIL